ncbi:MAG: GNAT family N-acetyltransferase [Pseudomonadales bacterium]
MADATRELEIRRLDAGHAAAIVACFTRVYGDSYANGLFYDASALATEIGSGRLSSVGALTPEGRILGHMAMVCHPDAQVAELGNTVVDPTARGGGLAWRIGRALSDWCAERGFPAYLHYPTTAHHIMQRQSVKEGFETGLMLGYVPAETDGQTGPNRQRLRGACTIVFNPLGDCPTPSVYLPARYADLLRNLARPPCLNRTWLTAPSRPLPSTTASVLTSQPRRGLARLEIRSAGADLDTTLADLRARPLPCLQVDLSLADPGIDAAVEIAHSAGFGFCGWLPGYRASDVLRLQRVDPEVTDLLPAVVNPTARELLRWCGGR